MPNIITTIGNKKREILKPSLSLGDAKLSNITTATMPATATTQITHQLIKTRIAKATKVPDFEMSIYRNIEIFCL